LEYLTGNNLQLLIFFVAPGFISLRIWGLIQPSKKAILSESIIEAIVFSSLNYIATAWIYWVLNPDLVWLYYVIVLIICPILWPIVLRFLLTRKIFRNKIINLIPKSWDYFFSKREGCFMLIHLNNGRIIGGLYGLDSFTSSYPEKEDIYLQEVWKVDEEGKFVEKIFDTKGLLVNYNAIEYIELFNMNEGERNHG
jgi:hypothetical protein